MKTRFLFVVARACMSLAAALSLSTLAHAQALPNWEAFNDYSSSPLTSPNATGYKLRTAGVYGPLKNFDTADDLPVSVSVETDGGTPDDFGARGGALDAGSPALLLFGGKVDLANDGLPGVRAAVKLTLVFSGLDPTKVYKFCGTVARGGSYNNRWSVFTITGVGNFVAAHVDGSLNKNIFTAVTYPPAAAALEPNQVALNAGHNKQGSLVCWNKIEPSGDGTIRIEALRYLGPTPFGDAPNAGTSYSYGFEAIYLAEFEATGDLRITEDPASQKVPAGQTATFTVAATSLDPITSYKWQKLAPGAADYVNIAAPNQPTYTTPALTVADDGTKFRCVVSTAFISATSGEATLTVDGVIPTVTRAIGSINFNFVYVTFSEAMKLDQLATLGNYELSGGLIINSVVALDATTAGLLTSAQAPGTAYTVTINNVEDLSGNPIPANSTLRFTSFSVITGTAGVELWYNIGGGAVNDLRSNARYPAEPDVDYATTSFDSSLVLPATSDLNTYGGRFRAWVVPAETGTYEFFLRGDDAAELRMAINLDDNFEDIDSPLNIPIAIAGAGPFQEPPSAGTSVPIFLEAGVKYALQAIWKEGNGTDYCQVAWRMEGDPTPAADLQPIPSQFLSYFGPVPPPTITSIALAAGKVVIEWTGAALESSADLMTWTEEVGAVSPFSVTPTPAKARRFYRSRN